MGVLHLQASTASIGIPWVTTWQEQCHYNHQTGHTHYHQGNMINLSLTIPLPRGEAKTFPPCVPGEVSVAVTLIHLAGS